MSNCGLEMSKHLTLQTNFLVFASTEEDFYATSDSNATVFKVSMQSYNSFISIDLITDVTTKRWHFKVAVCSKKFAELVWFLYNEYTP
jgi:hypothetical protein